MCGGLLNERMIANIIISLLILQKEAPVRGDDGWGGEVGGGGQSSHPQVRQGAEWASD